MSIFESIVLGFIQGFTEFIPISSSGHLDIIPRVLGWNNPPTTFILFLHIGTLLSLLVYYRKLIIRYLKVLQKKLLNRETLKRREERDFNKIKNVIVAVIPAILAGMIFEKFVSDFYDKSMDLKIIGPIILIPMILLGILFLFENRLPKLHKTNLNRFSPKLSLLIGTSQILAFIRGVSRSGITILTGRLAGLTRVEAAEFSFLMSIPILIGTTIYSLIKLAKLPSEQIQNELGIAVLGMLISFISGLFAVNFLLQFLKSKSLKIFGVYRIIFGVALLTVIFL